MEITLIYSTTASMDLVHMFYSTYLMIGSSVLSDSIFLNIRFNLFCCIQCFDKNLESLLTS